MQNALQKDLASRRSPPRLSARKGVSAILSRMDILRDKPSPDWEGRKAANRALYEDNDEAGE